MTVAEDNRVSFDGLKTQDLRRLPAKVLKKLLLKYHPDKGGEKADFQRVFEQYEQRKAEEALDEKLAARRQAKVAAAAKAKATASDSKSGGDQAGGGKVPGDTRLYNDGEFYERYFGEGKAEKSKIDQEELLKRMESLRARCGRPAPPPAAANAAGASNKAKTPGGAPRFDNRFGARPSSAKPTRSGASWQPPGGEVPQPNQAGKGAGGSAAKAPPNAKSSDQQGTGSGTRTATGSSAAGSRASESRRSSVEGAAKNARAVPRTTDAEQAGADGVSTASTLTTKGTTTKARTRPHGSQKPPRRSPEEWASVKQKWLRQESLLENLRTNFVNSKNRDKEDEEILRHLLRREETLEENSPLRERGPSLYGKGAEQEQNESTSTSNERFDDLTHTMRAELQRANSVLNEHEEAVLDLLFDSVDPLLGGGSTTLLSDDEAAASNDLSDGEDLAENGTDKRNGSGRMTSSGLSSDDDEEV
ncbi:unnamed protein product [Amoebophrya sp. A25]|nr:unnamed protein product [Amoebophrya sp. A25]|eukprot:GSA25T00001740001.1